MNSLQNSTSHRTYLSRYVLSMLLFFGFLILSSYIAPNYFGVPNLKSKMDFWVQLFNLLFFLPMVALLMFRWLHFFPPSSPNKVKAIIFLIVIVTFYLWAFLNIKGILSVFIPVKTFVLAMIMVLFLGILLTLIDEYDILSATMGTIIGFTVDTYMQITPSYDFTNHPYGLVVESAIIIFITCLLLATLIYGYSSRRLKIPISQLAKGIMIGVFCYFASHLTIT